MSAFDYNSLKAHIGHKIECVAYGDINDPANVAVECVDCSEVLLDYDKPTPDDKYKCESCGVTFESPDHGGCPDCHSINYFKLKGYHCLNCNAYFNGTEPDVCPECGEDNFEEEENDDEC